MAKGDEMKVLVVDDLSFHVEWTREGRVLCMGPQPSGILFTSFGRPAHGGWSSVHKMLAFKVREYIKEKPAYWKLWYAKGGKFDKLTQEITKKNRGRRA